MNWSDEYATGIENLDRQHQMLFRMSEDYAAALHEGAGGRVYGLLLESLHDYATAHFGIEEECMHRFRCPAAGANKEAHVQFIGAVNEFRRRFSQDGFDLAEAQSLVRFVDEWLAGHIGRIDTQLRPCVENLGPST